MKHYKTNNNRNKEKYGLFQYELRNFDVRETGCNDDGRIKWPGKFPYMTEPVIKKKFEFVFNSYNISSGVRKSCRHHSPSGHGQQSKYSR